MKIWTSRARALAPVLALIMAGCGPSSTSPAARPSARAADDLLARYLARGDEYRDAGLPAKAAEQYEAALALDDTNQTLYPRLGQALVQAGNAERAVKIHERWIALAPKDCAARAGLGAAHLAHGLPDQAVKTYEEALRICPEQARVWCSLGQAYEKSGYPLEAIEALRHSLELDAEDIAAREALARIEFDRHLYPQAAAMYESILARPDHGKDEAWIAWAHGRLAFLYHWGGSCPKAIPHWEAVAASAAAGSEEKIRALQGLVECQGQAGQFAVAIDAASRLVAATPGVPEERYRLGDLLNDAGRYDEAVEAARQGMEVDTACPAHAYCVMGRAFEKLGGLANFKRAEREFLKAMNCGDGPYHEIAVQEVARQQALVRAEEAKGVRGSP